MQDASLANELTQNAILRAYEGTGGFHGEAPERIWLLRVARSVCLDYVRSPRSRARAPASLDQAQAWGRELDSRGITIPEKEPPPTAEEAARQAEMSECVQQFVMSLSETLRTPVGVQNRSVSVGLTGQGAFPALVARISEGVKRWTLGWRRRGETVRFHTEKWAIYLAVTRS